MGPDMIAANGLNQTRIEMNKYKGTISHVTGTAARWDCCEAEYANPSLQSSSTPKEKLQTDPGSCKFPHEYLYFHSRTLSSRTSQPPWSCRKKSHKWSWCWPWTSCSHNEQDLRQWRTELVTHQKLAQCLSDGISGELELLVTLRICDHFHKMLTTMDRCHQIDMQQHMSYTWTFTMKLQDGAWPLGSPIKRGTCAKFDIILRSQQVLQENL
jgi:hypothetical protein